MNSEPATLVRLRMSDGLLGKVALAVAADSLLLQWAGYRQDAAEYARPAPPRLAAECSGRATRSCGSPPC
jgi:hypothetical protein